MYIIVGVPMHLQIVRPQIQHPLHRTIGASHFEPIYHYLHQLQKSFRMAPGRVAAVALVRAVVQFVIVNRLVQL
jgi:hypothetical protein